MAAYAGESGRRPAAIIFDLDGTLVDSATGIEACLREVSGRLGRGRVSRDRVRALISRGVGELVGESLASPDPETNRADVVAFRAAYAGRRTEVSELFAGVAEGLAALRAADHLLGVCTNKPQYLTERVLADTGIASVFRAVVGGDTATRSKPDPLHLADVARLLDVPLDDCVLVGDSEVDAAAAAAAGIPFAFVTWGYAMGGPIETAHRFDSFERLVAWLAGSEEAP